MCVCVCVCVCVYALFLAPEGPCTMLKRKAGRLATNSANTMSQTHLSIYIVGVTPAAVCKIYYYGYL